MGVHPKVGSQGEVLSNIHDGGTCDGGGRCGINGSQIDAEKAF